MAKEPFYLGRPVSVELNKLGLVVHFDEGGLTVLECPEWFRTLDVEVRERWKVIEGGLYWYEAGQTLQIPMPMVDQKKLAKALKKLEFEEE